MIFLILSGSFYFCLNTQIIFSSRFNNQEKIHSSGQTLYTKEWLKNNNFSTQDHWYSMKGKQGDNETVEAKIANDQANFKILGDNLNYTMFGIPNSTDSLGWDEFAKPGYYLPDNSGIDSFGSWVSHTWAELSNQFPGVHWRKNITVPVDMSEYNITSANLSVKFNASVETTSGESLDGFDVSLSESASNQFGIGDFITFYVLISDIDLKNPYVIAFNRTTDLGQDSPTIDTISGNIYTYDESVIITALNSAFEKDFTHSNITITLGIDIYCEDNWGSDIDVVNYAYFEECNFTFAYERKIEKFSSISWNQEGNIISGANIQISEAKLTLKANISQTWPTILSPFSEMSILINDNLHTETLSLGSLNTTFDIIIFDVTNLILKDVNITLEIQVFMANTFSLDKNITISIDDVYLNISYYETFPDYITDIDLSLNNLNKTQDKVIQIPINNVLNITIKYTNQSTGLHIPNATVQIGGDLIGSLNENFTLKQYSMIFNTSKLGIGIKSLTVEARKDNYETQSITFFVTVVERATELLLIVDNNLIDDGDTINSGVNEILNITANFRDNITKKFLSSANVELLSMDNLTEAVNYYNVTINTNELDQGINVLIMHAKLENYTSQTFEFFIKLNERDTELEIFVNNIQYFESDTRNVVLNEILNITVFFKDNLTKQHLGGASVELIGVDNLTEISNYYNITINSNDLEQGINVLIINAQLENYTSQTYQLFIDLNDRDTTLLLFVNNTPKYDGDTITIKSDEILDVAVFYRDSLTNTHLSGAIVDLLGVSNLTETVNSYILTITTQDLNPGITIFTITAQLNNYQSQKIQFNVKVVERAIELQLFLNMEAKTLDPVIELPLGSILNITIKYTENQSGLFIENSLIQLRGDSLSINFIENLNYEQFSFILNTTILKIGVNLLTITANATNFQIGTIYLRITINKITGVISSVSGEPYINIIPGESAKLRIMLNDSDFGAPINNATIIYRWTYGQGVLRDQNNDGIYEADLLDIPEGSYTITITASAGDKYNFRSYEITVSAIRVPKEDQTWIIYVLSGGIVGLISVFSVYQLYFKYPPLVRKIRKLRKSIRKGKKRKPFMLKKREESIKIEIQNQVRILEIESENVENNISEKKSKEKKFKETNK